MRLIRVVIPVSSALMLGLLASSCDSPADPIDEDPPLPESCSEPGGTAHAGTSALRVWRAIDGPHRVTADLNAGDLTIEAGSLVCVSPDVTIRVLHLVIEGTEERRVVITAADTARKWGGLIIEEDGTASFHHASIENAGTSALPGPSAVVVRGGATTQIEFVDSAILGSAGMGLWVGARVRLTLIGGRIEGSADFGLSLWDQAGGRSVRLTEARPIRITGGGSYPARVPLRVAAALLESGEAQAGWTGNARDTVLVTTRDFWDTDSLTIHAGLAWAIGSEDRATEVRSLRLEPGASLHLTDHGSLHGLRTNGIVSHGTAEAPVTIAARRTQAFHTGGQLHLRGSPSEPSQFRHTRLVGVLLDSSADHPAVFEDLVSESVHLGLGAAGTRLTRVRLADNNRGRFGKDAIVTISGPGIEMSSCEVVDSRGDGVHVEVADGVRISDCDIHGNAGAGVVNFDSLPVAARDNWWGDPAGPFGPAGDGVDGLVDYDPWRTEPTGSATALRGLGFRSW